MEDSDFIPCKISRKITTDFIDNRMAAYHPAFDRPPLRYDSHLGEYVPDGQALVMAFNNASSATGLQASNASPSFSPLPVVSVAIQEDGHGWQLSPRAETTDLQSMSFWSTILPQAMKQLRETKEPKSLIEKRCGIRDKEEWSDIYATLEASRSNYQEVEGPLGRITSLRRKAADNLGPVSNFFKTTKNLVPDSPYTKPILGAVELVLDAAKRAAQARKEALESFDLDNLIDVFSSVELFLSLFPGDQNITKKSIHLTVSILEGIERAITFFRGNALKRAFKALGAGEDYAKGLKDSLATIQIRSKALMDEASRSSMHKQEMHMQQNQLLHQQTWQRIDYGFATAPNRMKGLLDDYVERLERKLDSCYRELAHRIPSPLPSSPWPSPPQAQLQGPSHGVDQNTLRHLLGFMDTDLKDLTLINERKGQISDRQRARAEQIVSAALFQQWIISTDSSKLLVQWNDPTTEKFAGISPLTVLCTTMAEALRNRNRFISVLWFCGLHCNGSDPDSCNGGQAMLVSIVDQILRQHLFYTGNLHNEIQLNFLRGGKSLNELLQLLGWLVRSLPPTLTLFFLVDGVYIYEREEFWSTAQHVFLGILQLLNDPSVTATIKVLFASAPGATNVRGAFETAGLILSVDELPKLGWAPSDERMIREMGIDAANTST